MTDELRPAFSNPPVSIEESSVFAPTSIQFPRGEISHEYDDFPELLDPETLEYMFMKNCVRKHFNEHVCHAKFNNRICELVLPDLTATLISPLDRIRFYRIWLLRNGVRC